MVCVKLLFYFILFVSSIAQRNVTIKDPEIDTILQIFYNCTCIPYYLCQESIIYAQAARNNLLPSDFYCLDAYFFCCQNHNSTITTTPSSTDQTTEPISATTITSVMPKNRAVNAKKTVCGEAKTHTQIFTRILTPEEDSALTIPGEVPWMVEIFRKKKRHGLPYFVLQCSGSLIHPKVVLTAMHCVVSNTPESLKVIANGLTDFQNIGINTTDERGVSAIIKHPEYYSGGLHNDIALLILSSPYELTNNFLNTICLPPDGANFDDKRCIVAGWGRNIDVNSTVPLAKVDVPIVEFNECQNLLRKTELGSAFTLHSSFICAGGEAGKDSCRGDGGGPLMCIGPDYTFVQMGIVSWGVGGACGKEGQPGIYTSVGQFKVWIKKELKQHNISVE